MLADFCTRIKNALRYSLQGLQAAYKNQWPFRIEIYSCIITIPLALILGKTAVERVLLIGAVLLIIIVELLNSAVETAIDRISLERHELSGRAKDIAAAAVLVAIINAVVVWGLVIF